MKSSTSLPSTSTLPSYHDGQKLRRESSTFQTTMTASPSLSTAFFSVSSFTPWFQVIDILQKKLISIKDSKNGHSTKDPWVGNLSLYEGHLLWRLHFHLLWRLVLVLRKRINSAHFITFSSVNNSRQRNNQTLAMFFVLQLLSTAFSPLNSVEFRLTWSNMDTRELV